MKSLSRFLAVVGFLLILFAVMLKALDVPLMIGTIQASLTSLLILANICFSLAILVKK